MRRTKKADIMSAFFKPPLFSSRNIGFNLPAYFFVCSSQALKAHSGLRIFLVQCRAVRFCLRKTVTLSHPKTFLLSPTPSEYGSSFESTEKEGFEPSMQNSPHNTLAGCRLQPLGHFSKNKFSIIKYYQKYSKQSRI